MPSIADILSQNFNDPNRSDENKFGVDLGKFGGDSDLFTEITNDLVEPTKKETYDSFFDIKTREAENEYMKLIGQQGYTKQGQATGFAGSTSQDMAMDSLESAYASSVMDVEEAIGGKMSDAKMAVANTIADNKSTLLQLKQMEQSKPKGGWTSVIFTAAYQQGIIPMDYVWKVVNWRLTKYKNFKVWLGYQIAFKPVAKLMRNNLLFAKFIKRTLILPWMNIIDNKIGFKEKLVQRFIESVSIKAYKSNKKEALALAKRFSPTNYNPYNAYCYLEKKYRHKQNG